MRRELDTAGLEHIGMLYTNASERSPIGVLHHLFCWSSISVTFYILLVCEPWRSCESRLAILRASLGLLPWSISRFSHNCELNSAPGRSVANSTSQVKLSRSRKSLEGCLLYVELALSMNYGTFMPYDTILRGKFTIMKPGNCGVGDYQGITGMAIAA